MKIEIKKFEIKKWKSYDQEIIQPYIQDLLGQVIKDPKNCFYRGGFGRIQDYKRLIKTGSDYENAIVKTKSGIRAAVYASQINKVGKEPWCRGFDPLYWALIGHKKKKWNPINCIVAYSLDKVDILQNSNILLFRSAKPSTNSIEAIILLEFNKFRLY